MNNKFVYLVGCIHIVSDEVNIFFVSEDLEKAEKFFDDSLDCFEEGYIFKLLKLELNHPYHFRHPLELRIRVIPENGEMYEERQEFVGE